MRHADTLTGVLRALPADVDLADASLTARTSVADLGRYASETGIGLALLSKVLHRKRQGLVPMAKRAVIQRYAPITGTRGSAAWTELVRVLAQELSRRRTAARFPRWRRT